MQNQSQSRIAVPRRGVRQQGSSLSRLALFCKNRTMKTQTRNHRSATAGATAASRRTLATIRPDPRPMPKFPPSKTSAFTVTIPHDVAHYIQSFIDCSNNVEAEDFIQLAVETSVKSCLEDYEILLGTIMDAQTRFLARTSESEVQS